MKVIILIMIMIFCVVNGSVYVDGNFLVKEPQVDLISPECSSSVKTPSSGYYNSSGHFVSTGGNSITKKYLLTRSSAKENYQMQPIQPKMSGWWVYLVNLDEQALVDNLITYPKIEKITDNFKAPGNKEYDAIFEIFNSAQVPTNQTRACSLYCSPYQGKILPFFPVNRPTDIDWFRNSLSSSYLSISSSDYISSDISNSNTKPKVGRVENFIRNLEFPGIVKGVFWLGRGGNNLGVFNYKNQQTIPQEYYLAVVVDYNVQQKQYAVSSFYQSDTNTIFYPSRPMSWNEWKDVYKDHPDFHKFYETLIAHLGVESDPYPVDSSNSSKIAHLDRLLGISGSFFLSYKGGGETYFDGEGLLFAGTDVFTKDSALKNEDKLWWVNSKEATKARKITNTNIDTYMDLLDKADGIETYMGSFPKWNAEYNYTPRIRYIIPIDDFQHNSNSPIFKNAPDMRLYFGLYANQFHREYIEEKTVADLSPGNFSSFLDYAKYKLYINVKDNAIYNAGGNKLSSYKMNPDQPPEEAYYYAHAKDGTMRPINDKAPKAFERNFNPETARYLLVRSEMRITKEGNGAANFFSGAWLIGGLFYKNRTIAIPIDLDISVSGFGKKISHPKPELEKLEYSADDIEAYFETEEFAELKKILERNKNNPENLKNEYVPEYDTNGVVIAGKKTGFSVNISLPNSVIILGQVPSKYYLGGIMGDLYKPFDTSMTKYYLTTGNTFYKEITFSFPVLAQIGDKCVEAGSVTYTQEVTPTLREKVHSKRGYWYQERKISDILSDASESVAEAISKPDSAISGNLENKHIYFRPNGKYKEYKEKNPNAKYYIANARDGYRQFDIRNPGYIKYSYLYDEFGATSGEPLQIHETVIGNTALIRPYQETAVYLKLRFPVIAKDTFNVAPIVGYIYYGDVGFCSSPELLSYVKNECFAQGDTIYKNPNDTLKVILDIIKEDTCVYIRYDANTNERIRIETNENNLQPDYNNCPDDKKIYYTFLFRQQKNLIRPGWTSYSNFNIEMWAASGYDQLGNGRIGRTVLGISDGNLKFEPYWAEKNDNNIEKKRGGNITSWLTPYYTPQWKYEDDDKEMYPYSSGDLEWESFQITGKSHLLIYDKRETLVDLVRGYDKRTKEYYTDQKNINERDKDVEGNEEWWKIALKIVVAEGFNITMKVMHKLAEKYEYLQPVEASAILMQDKISNNIAYKIAKEAYRTYCIWRTTMDTAAEIRDRAKDAKEAWQGLQETFNGLKNYYTEFDWKSVKMTNISKVLPNRHIYNFKTHLNYMENSNDRLMAAIDKMAFHSDTTFRGNYGLLNPLINWASAKLATGLQSTFAASDKIQDLIGVDYSFGFDEDYVKEYGNKFNAKGMVDERSKNLDDVTKNKRRGKGMLDSLTKENDTQDGRTFSRAAYLSNITILAKGAVHEISMDVLNDEISALSVTLSTIESDSKSWLQYVNYQQEWGERFKENFKATDYYDTIYDTLSGVRKVTSNGKSALKGFMKAIDYPNSKVFSSGADNALYQLQDWSRKGDKRPGDGKITN